MIFKNQQHYERFEEALRLAHIQLQPEIRSTEVASCLYLLTVHSSTWKKVQVYIHFDNQFMNIKGILEEVDLSGGQSVLVHLAGNLFNGRTTHCDAVELMRLGPENFQIAISAIQFRKDGRFGKFVLENS